MREIKCTKMDYLTMTKNQLSLNNLVCDCCNCINKPREGCWGTISLTTILKNPKKDAKRETKNNLKKDIIGRT